MYWCKEKDVLFEIHLDFQSLSGPDISHVHWCLVHCTACSENHVEYVLPVCIVTVSDDTEQYIHGCQYNQSQILVSTYTTGSLMSSFVCILATVM